MLSDGTIQCWGRNNQRQLGIGSTDELAAPGKSVVGISTAVSVSAGREHTCALLLNGGALCWGNGSNGRLGNGSTDNQNSPVTVSGITTAVAVGAGRSHSCAVLADGSTQCWGGDGDGRLGNGSELGDSNTPTDVLNVPTARAVITGDKLSLIHISEPTRPY